MAAVDERNLHELQSFIEEQQLVPDFIRHIFPGGCHDENGMQ